MENGEGPDDIRVERGASAGSGMSDLEEDLKEKFQPNYQNEQQRTANAESGEEYSEMNFVDRDTKRANNRFRVQFETMKLNDRYDPRTSGSSFTQQIERQAEAAKLTPQEYLNKAKDVGLIDQDDGGDGFFAQRATTGTVMNQFDVESRQKKPSSLERFLDDSEQAQDMEEEDIYSIYKKKLDDSKKAKRETQINQAKLDSFMNSEAKKF